MVKNDDLTEKEKESIELEKPSIWDLNTIVFLIILNIGIFYAWIWDGNPKNPDANILFMIQPLAPYFFIFELLFINYYLLAKLLKSNTKKRVSANE